MFEKERNITQALVKQKGIVPLETNRDDDISDMDENSEEEEERLDTNLEMLRAQTEAAQYKKLRDASPAPTNPMVAGNIPVRGTVSQPPASRHPNNVPTI